MIHIQVIINKSNKSNNKNQLTNKIIINNRI